MQLKILDISNNWLAIKNSALNTISKESTKEPSSQWKRQILLAEHSPIRKLKISAKWIGLKSWISVHFVRHKIGIEHFVSTQRDDRTDVDRNKEPQDNPVNHEFEANAQAIINISRKRLCLKAHRETRMAWIDFMLSFKDIEPELYSACVSECIYRGYCFEFDSCGFYKTELYQEQLRDYREGINQDDKII